mmetsp:Transcript_20616/g.66123  ORF Transcript_20616/g.66123 Transcript_20616/m.66123 type:complete len:292 (-) Transcript_20616:195-1070(-)
MMASIIWMMGSMTNCTNARLILPFDSRIALADFFHFLVAMSKYQSPHRRSRILVSATLNFLAYMRANLDRVNAHWCSPEPNATVPAKGYTCTSPSVGSWYVEMITFTFSIVFCSDWYRSSGSICSSRMARSTLLHISTGRMRSPSAWRSTVSVCTHTPEMASTTTSAPSVTRSAAVTSDEKSTCPGESIRLIRYDLELISMSTPSSSVFTPDPAVSTAASSTSAATSALDSSGTNSGSGSYSKYSEIPVDLIVMHRSCSSARVSVKRASPAFLAAIMPALDTSESVRVDLP